MATVATMTTATPWPDPEGLSRDWDTQVGVAPIGSDLRTLLSDRWVRFHYLPDSERIATTAAQRAEVLARYRAVLAALTAASGDEGAPLLVLTSGWDETTPAERPADLAALLPAVMWRSVPRTGEQPATIYASALVGEQADETLSELLLDWVVADRTADVIVAPTSLSWLLHPYDGGMDVIAPDTATRDRLRRQFGEWLSPLPSGL